MLVGQTPLTDLMYVTYCPVPLKCMCLCKCVCLQNDVDDLTILNFAKETFYGLRNSLNSSFKASAQYSLNELIIDCTYKGTVCNNV